MTELTRNSDLVEMGIDEFDKGGPSDRRTPEKTEKKEKTDKKGKKESKKAKVMDKVLDEEESGMDEEE